MAHRLRPRPQDWLCTASIGRLQQREDAAWLAELLIDLEEDEPARLRLVAALRTGFDQD